MDNRRLLYCSLSYECICHSHLPQTLDGIFFPDRICDCHIIGDICSPVDCTSDRPGGHQDIQVIVQIAIPAPESLIAMEFIYSTRNNDAPVAFASFEAMHTVFEMVAVHVEESQARSLAEDIRKYIGNAEKILNRHDPESVFAAINSSKGPVQVDDETFALLQFCDVFRRSTDGYFDISSLSEKSISPAYSLDADSRSVTLADGGIVLDAGGFGKGYALDHIRKMIQDAGVKDALVNFGDSSVTGMGTHPFGDGWKVASSRGEGNFILRDSSLSVSGLRPDGSAHIINPKNRRVVSGSGMIAVEGRSAFVCEVLSTALYSAPAEMRSSIIAEFEGYCYKEIKQIYG